MSHFLLSISRNCAKRFFSNDKKRASMVAFFCQEKIPFSHNLLYIAIRASLVISILFSFQNTFSQQKTYCNPINIDYGYTPFKIFSQQGKHRATADPVIVNFQKKFFLFSTNQEGYWWSENMLNWKFVYRKFLLDKKYTHDLNAPGVFAMKDTHYMFTAQHTKKIFQSGKAQIQHKTIGKLQPIH